MSEVRTAAESVIDCAMWTGAYPFRGIPTSSVEHLRRKMAELRIERGIIAPFEGIFWENGLDAYERCAEELAGEAALEVWPVLRPGATAGLQRLLDRYRPRGLRLLPNYHGYRLYDPPAAELMALARERGMIVQVFQRIADERWHWMLKTPAVDFGEIDYATSAFDQPMLISAAGGIGPIATRLRQRPNLFADLSRVRGPQFGIEALVRTAPVGQLVFGSLWPIQIIEASLWQLTTARIDDATRSAILSGNARRMLGLARPAENAR